MANEISEMLKGKIVYQRVNTELLEIIENMLKSCGKKDLVKIGDIVAMDEHRCWLSSEDEMRKIPKEKIISVSSQGKEKNLMGMMHSREIIAIDTYKKVLQLVEELHHHSNATETTFLIDIEIFLKDKIDYYEHGGT